MNRTLMGLVLAVILIVSMVPAAGAQEPRLTATIPFDFYTGKMLLPAGVYVFESPEPGVQIMRNASTQAFVMQVRAVRRGPSQRAARGSVIFNRYGDDHFLSQIWWPDAEVGRETVKGPVELGINTLVARPAVEAVTAAGN